MSFSNPFYFAAFFVFFLLYWSVPRSWQNTFLFIGSYAFCWALDWHAAVWLGLTSLITVGVVVLLDRTAERKQRMTVLFFGLMLCFGVLAFFKYFHFLSDALSALTGEGDSTFSSLAIPVGMSFFVFKATSYMIDVYRQSIGRESTLSILNYIAFFPELAAGPIDRAGTLIPQLKSRRVFNAEQAAEAVGQILWGLIKKVVIADSLADAVAVAYGATTATGPQLLLATYFFTFQLYCDFSGYSDIASGCARLLGFSTCRNFAYPFFSRSFGEYWSRWHMSLTGWFRDYVYIPLGGRRCSRSRFVLNILIVFALSGIWHGTGYTFLVWGLLNGVFLVVFYQFENNRTPRQAIPGGERLLPKVSDLLSIIFVFHFVLLAWVFFRAESVAQGISIIFRIIQHPFDLSLSVYGSNYIHVCLIAVLVAAEWLIRRYDHPFAIPWIPGSLRWGLCLFAAFVVAGFGKFNNAPFIYFKF